MLTITLAGLRVRWRKLLLSALAVALGVAFTAGTLIYTDTVNASYYSQFAAQAKNVDASVVPDDDGTLALSDLAAVRSVSGVAAAEGRLQGSLTLVGANGRAYSATAIDLPADLLLRSWTVPSGGGGVLLDKDTAELNDVTVGTRITVLDHDGHARKLVVSGIADMGASGNAYPGAVLILPAATLRSLTGVSAYQRIDVVAEPGVSQATLATRVAGLRLAHARAETGTQLAQTLAERNVGGESVLSVGLLIFALVSLLVAALVIYNSFRILMAQRLREVALLRCVGATRRQVLSGVLGESAVLGLVAGVTGAGLAILLVAAVADGGAVLSWGTVVMSLVIGVVVTVGAALLPAVAASSTAPVAALRAPHEGTVRGVVARVVVALLLGGGGVALTVAGMPIAKTGLYMIAAGGTLFFLGFLAIAPLVSGPLASLLGWVPARVFGVRMRLAITGARRNPSRTATTTAALTIGIGLMTLFSVVLSTATQFATHEMSRHFPADYLLSGGVPAGVVTSLRSSPLISQAAEVRYSAVGLGEIMAVEPTAYSSVFMPYVTSGSLPGVVSGTGRIALSGTVARHLGVAVGVHVTVAGRSYVVAAIFSEGVLSEDALISWADYTRAFGPGDATDVLVKARTGVSSAASAAVVNAAIARYPLIDVTSEASLRAHMLASVNKLSDLLDGLLATSIVIALAGMANTLSLSVLERTRESALLRALGLTRGQLRRMIGMEAVLLGVMGAVAGAAFGTGFGWATGRAFLRTDGGPVSFPVLEILGYMALAGAAALLASLIPARRAARLSVIDALAPD
jgi:putative ABC transport system permease protein